MNKLYTIYPIHNNKYVSAKQSMIAMAMKAMRPGQYFLINNIDNSTIHNIKRTIKNATFATKTLHNNVIKVMCKPIKSDKSKKSVVKPKSYYTKVVREVSKDATIVDNRDVSAVLNSMHAGSIVYIKNSNVGRINSLKRSITKSFKCKTIGSGVQVTCTGVW